MKKILALIFVSSSLMALAQKRVAPANTHKGAPLMNSFTKADHAMLEKPATIPVSSFSQQQGVSRKIDSGNHTQTICESSLGSAGRPYYAFYGSWSNFWYNQDINSLVFVHVSKPVNTSYTIGFIQYDYSTDGGVSWTNNQSFLYTDTTYNSSTGYEVQRGRYPQGGIYNPPGNTNPSNAYACVYGSATNGLSTPNDGWPWHYEGTSLLGSSANNQQLFNNDLASGGLGGNIPQGGIIVRNTGDAWWTCRGWIPSAYDDTVILSHGIFNSATHDYDYTFKKIPAPVCTNVSGYKMFYDCAVTFNDAGNIGYVALLGNDWCCNAQPLDSAIGLIVFKTTDGGNTWNKLPGPNLDLVDPLLLSGGYSYQVVERFDLGMDKNDHLHIVLPIVPYDYNNTIYLSYTYGSYGIFDVTTTNDVDWNACLIAKPETFYGQYGTVGSSSDPAFYEENRAQFSRSWDGSKIFYTWFDTDTSIFGPGLNTYPDAHCIGLDVDAGLYTADANLTAFTGTTADGGSNVGQVCYYTVNDGTNETIPIIIDVLGPTTLDPVDFFYEGCGAITNFVNAGNCTPLSLNPVVQGIPGAVSFGVSANYPNPFSGKTMVDVTLPEASDVTIEISNAIGQMLSSFSYKNLNAGINSITIDGATLSKGLYFYTVKAGNKSVTKTMSVE